MRPRKIATGVAACRQVTSYGHHFRSPFGSLLLNCGIAVRWDIIQINMSTLETRRLHLRLFTPEDLENLHKLLRDPDVVKYTGTGKPVSLEETKTALNSILKHWERHGFGRWAVIDKATNQFIGYGGLRILVDTPEVVYHLAKSFWGQGLATEMARESLRYGFEDNNFERIVAIAKPDNAASIHVMEKIGMSYEKRATYYTYDVVQYCISRESYRP